MAQSHSGHPEGTAKLGHYQKPSGGKGKMDIPRFTERISKERNCAPELVNAIVTDCLAALHESTVKHDIGTALIGAYWELGPLPAWHFGGILARAAEHDPGELIEHYQRLDPDDGALPEHPGAMGLRTQA